MADNNIRDENYYTIHGWMINQLGLKGVQLSVYAIIYGFSQDGENEYRGRIQYLCDFTGGTSKPTIIKALKELVDKGYLQKRDEVINGVLLVRYRAIHPVQIGDGKEILPPVKNFNGGSKEILPPPGKKILPPTLHNNNSDIDIEREGVVVIPQICENLANSPPKCEIPPPLTETRFRLSETESTESEISHPISHPAELLPLNPKEVAHLFNIVCPHLNPVKYMTSKREAAIRSLPPNCTMEKIRQCFEIAESSDFLKGSNDLGWKATFDWLIDPDNMAKVLEGNYTDDGDVTDNNGGSFDTDDFYQAAVEKALGESFDTA